MSLPISRGLSRLACGLLILLLCACSKGTAAEASPSNEKRAPEASGIVLLRIDKEISTGALVRLKRATEQALATDAKTLVLEMDTPGGSIETMWNLEHAITKASESGLLTVAWVNDQALSAGVLLALACDRIYSVPHGAIGAAAPVMIGPGGVQELPEELAEKQKSVLRGEFRAWAELRNRPGVLAEAMVDSRVEVLEVEIDKERRLLSRTEWEDLQTRGEPGRLIRKVDGDQSLLTLTANEAVESGFIDGIAPTLARLLDKVGHSGESPRLIEASGSEKAIDLLAKISPILLAFGLMLLWTEVKAPGFGISGILGLGCLAVVLAGRYLTGLADVPHLAMVGLGLLLIGLELLVLPGTLWLGLLGGVLFVGGLFMAQVGPGFSLESPLDRLMAFDASFSLISTLFISLIGSLLLLRLLPHLPFTGGLVTAPTDPAVAGGKEDPEAPDAAAIRRSIRAQASGVALTALRPAGKVRLDVEPDLEHEARSDGPVIEAGAPVQVVRLEAGDRLVVRAQSDTTSPTPDS